MSSVRLNSIAISLKSTFTLSFEGGCTQGQLFPMEPTLQFCFGKCYWKQNFFQVSCYWLESCACKQQKLPLDNLSLRKVLERHEVAQRMEINTEEASLRQDGKHSWWAIKANKQPPYQLDLFQSLSLSPQDSNAPEKVIDLGWVTCPFHGQKGAELWRTVPLTLYLMEEGWFPKAVARRRGKDCWAGKSIICPFISLFTECTFRKISLLLEPHSKEL